MATYVPATTSTLLDGSSLDDNTGQDTVEVNDASTNNSTALTGPAEVTTFGDTGTTTPTVTTTTATSPGDSLNLADQYKQAALARENVTTPAFAGYEKTTPAPTTPRAEDYMTPETSVAHQLEQLMSSNSGLSKLSKTKAREEASALGMGSSSGELGAVVRENYKTFMPLAESEASTAKDFKMAQYSADINKNRISAEAAVSGDLVVQKAKIEEQQKKIEDSFNATIRGLDAENAKVMQDLKGQWETVFKKVDESLQKELQKQTIDADVEARIMNQAHDMMNQYQISIQQLLANDSFMQSVGDDPKVMHNIFNDMLTSTTAAIEFSARSAGVYDDSFASYLDDLIEDATW